MGARSVTGWAVTVFAAVAVAAGTTAAGSITAEKLGEFYPRNWEARALTPPAYSNLVLPGFQKAATTRYYDFGSVEITYYDRKDATTREISGCQVALFSGDDPGRAAKALADIGGEIVIAVDCGPCKGQDEILEKIAAFDLKAMAGLVQ